VLRNMHRFGRDTFEESMKIVGRTGMDGVAWQRFAYMAFDAPLLPLSYFHRYAALLALPSNRFMQVAPKEECKDIQHLERLMQDTIDGGGEGVILRNPEAMYESGRSRGFLKLKTTRDAEAKIVGCQGLNFWQCELPNGVTFTAPPGTMEFVKRQNLEIGDIVTFKHRGFMLGSKKPKSPSLSRIRPELTWGDVVAAFKEGQKKRGAKAIVLRKRIKEKGYWKKSENRRKFFCEFARQMGFDPLVPENWENVSLSKLLKKGGSGLLPYFRTNHRAAVIDAFPELKFRSDWATLICRLRHHDILLRLAPHGQD